MFYDFIYLAKGFRMRPKVWSTLRPKHSVKKLFFKEFLEKSISKTTFHAVVFYIAYTNITNIYGVERWEFAK